MAILIDTRTGPFTQADGSGDTPLRQGRTAALITADAHGRYFEAVTRNQVFYTVASGVTPSAFTGGAGGTPLIGLMNPTGTGKNLVLIAASVSMTAVLSAAGVATPEIWMGVSANPTGTKTDPINMLSQTATGSIARAFINTAMTGSTAITFVIGLPGFWWATAAAGAATGMGPFEFGGMIVVAPGNLAALAVRTAPAGLAVDATLIWEEVPQ